MENRFEHFLKQQNSKPTASEAEFYRKMRPYHAEMLGEEKHFELLRDAMRINPGERILEVGIGNFIKGFSKYSSEPRLFVGVDIDEKMIEYLRRWAKENDRREQFLAGDGTKLPFKKGSFDRVIFHSFTGNFEKSITEARRVLRTGGDILIVFLMPKHYIPDEGFLLDIKKFWEFRRFRTIVPFSNTVTLRNDVPYNRYYTAIARKK